MVYFVYLLGCYKKSKLTTYVGYTNDLKKRLNLHNRGKGAKFTRGRTWKLLYSEKFIRKSNIIKDLIQSSLIVKYDVNKIKKSRVCSLINGYINVLLLDNNSLHNC